jgi:pimeloyl-ACP methyl ester carboxylesterase
MKRIRSLLFHLGTGATVAWFMARQTTLAQPGADAPIGRDATMASEPDDSKHVKEKHGSHTAGGLVFWRDERFFHDWRIQRHCWTGQCRLLDGANRRHEAGTFDECQKKLDEIRVQRGLGPMKGRAVVLVHGLGAVRALMAPLGEELERHGYTVFNVTYPSTRSELAEHARGLASIIAGLEGIEEINLVGHSMGNIVVRHWLGDCRDGRTQPDARLRRIVMIAPPNHGAEMASSWGRNVFFTTFAGQSALELGVGWGDVEKRLATPWVPFGIIAGGKGDDKGFNKHIDGDDDGLVSVATTKLDGAADYALLPYPHTTLLFKPETHERVVRFLDEGRFVAPAAPE